MKSTSESIKSEFTSLVKELILIPNEERESEILERLDEISPDPKYLDYIFNSYEFYSEDDELDMEAITKKVFGYKPICL